MAEAIRRPPLLAQWWAEARVDLGQLLPFVASNGAAADVARKVIPFLEDVEVVAGELAERVAASTDQQELANAAGICRWELLRLGERVRDVTYSRPKGHWATLMRHLTGGAAAAQILSSGYRFHSIDRICRGGEELEQHLEPLARLRIKLTASHPPARF